MTHARSVSLVHFGWPSRCVAAATLGGAF